MREVYEKGCAGAIENIEYIKQRIELSVTTDQMNIKREIYKSKDPIIEFDKINIQGMNKIQKNYIENRFTKSKNSKISIEEAERVYFGLLSDSKVEDIKIDINKNDSSGYELNMDMKLNNNLEASLGGLITSTNANRIYLGLAYRMININAFDFVLGTQIGRTYNTAVINSKMILPNKHPKSLEVKVAYWNQKFYESDKLFSTNETPCFIKEDEEIG